MNDFLKVNEGLSRRIPYRYTFEAYTTAQLLEIFKVMCEVKGETLEEGVLETVSEREITEKCDLGQSIVFIVLF